MPGFLKFFEQAGQKSENPLIYDTHMPCCLLHSFFSLYMYIYIVSICYISFCNDCIVFTWLLVSVICLLNVLNIVTL